MIRTIITSVILLILTVSSCAAADTSLRFSFESGGLGDWKIVEGGFGEIVSGRERYHGIDEAYGRDGAYFLSTLERGDGSPNDGFTGVIESPVFVPDDPDMSFLIGGGKHRDTYIALCAVDGREVLYARGSNSERMRHVEWSVPELVGKRVFIRIVDESTAGWGHVTFDGFTASGEIDEAATHARFSDLDFLRYARRVRRMLESYDPEALHAAVTDLSKTFPGEYRRGNEYLDILSDIEAIVDTRSGAFTNRDRIELASVEDAVKRFETLRREALLANPLVRRNPILFTVRDQYLPDHHNTATIFQTGEVNTLSFRGGGALKVLYPADGMTETLVEMPNGNIRDPEVDFDGGRVVFSMRRDIADDYHIYEVSADGDGFRQLTYAAGVSDIDPLYLPDGSIVFSSTREPKFCMCNKHIMANLFRMEADGANIHQIGKSTLFEGHGTLTPDGRVLYDRWEYVDRNFGDAQALWTCNPDGTNHALYWGNNTNSPGGVIDARIISGTERAICVFGSCHDRPWGALAIIDRRLGLDLRDPVIRTWPPEAIGIVGHGNWDAFLGVRPKYEDPYPLSDTYFLCSRMTGEGERMGIYLIDTFGNEVLLHEEGAGCYDPMPLSPRLRPNVIPSRRKFTGENGRFYVVDVYQGTHMRGVEPGAVKYLRVIESPEKRTWNYYAWSGQGTLWPAMNWHDFLNKRILGTVPVEDDGSVYCELPAEKFVYFQLLDENGMMIQSMRSGTIVQPGEVTGCIGCHENRRTAPLPAYTTMPIAMEKPPAKLTGWRGEQRLFSYMKEVQPVFDRSCVRCHDFGKPAGDRLNLAPDRSLTFNTSYNELWRKSFLSAIGGGPSEIQQPFSWGSHASRLIEVVQSGHKGVELDAESFDRLVTWIDINAPYYPVYTTAYPDNLAGRSPLSPAQLARLGELTGVPFEKLAGHNTNRGVQISFDRPEASPCLAELKENNEAAYTEALDIIRSGSDILARNPRADMDGHVPCLIDQLRLGKYDQRRQIELLNRHAINSGEKLYDTDITNGEARRE